MIFPAIDRFATIEEKQIWKGMPGGGGILKSFTPSVRQYSTPLPVVEYYCPG